MLAVRILQGISLVYTRRGDEMAASGLFGNVEMKSSSGRCFLGVWQTRLGALARKNDVICPLQEVRRAAAGQAPADPYSREMNAKQTDWDDHNERLFDLLILSE